MTYRPDLVFYHHPCTDGLTSAAVVFDKFGDTPTYIPFDYGNKGDINDLIDTVRDKNVLMVDCSFKLDDLDKLQQSAESIIIIDHHAGVIKDLQAFFAGSYVPIDDFEKIIAERKINVIFDNQYSGAELTYLVMNPKQEIPLFIQHVGAVDRNEMDKFSNLNLFRSWSRSIPFDIKEMLDIIYENTSDDDFERIAQSGIAINNYVNTRMSVLVDQKRTLTIGGQEIPFVVTDYAFASDVANRLLTEDNPLAIAFYFTKQGLGASIRTKGKVDAIAIAKRFGGNGHANAAGFNIPFVDVGEFLIALEIEDEDNMLFGDFYIQEV